MEKAANLPSSLFVGHRYARHGGRESRGSHCNGYRTYLVPENHDLPDAIVLAYGDSTYAKSRANALSERKVGSSGEAGVDLEDSGYESSKESNEKNFELPDFNLETRTIPVE